MNSKSVLLRLLIRAIRKERKSVSTKWNRVLSSGDYLNDRWEKAKYLGFGEGSSVYDSCIVLGEVKVGAQTWIGPFTILDGSGGLEIGDYCSISAGVQIYSHDTTRWATTFGVESAELSPTVIESGVYIGPNVVIQRGVVIGTGAVIGANSFVNRSIPPNSRAWGTPCRVHSNEQADL